MKRTMHGFQELTTQIHKELSVVRKDLLNVPIGLYLLSELLKFEKPV